VKKGIIFEIDQEAIRIVETMPKWSPGYQDGNPIPVKYRLPLNFNPD